MNFTDWLDSLTQPIYEVEGKPECPPGYKWDKKTQMCVPRTKKDVVSDKSGRDMRPENGASYNTIGSHGQNGAPYAYEEPAGDSE